MRKRVLFIGTQFTSKEISMVQWLTESRFGISKFGIPIEGVSCRLYLFLKQ